MRVPSGGYVTPALLFVTFALLAACEGPAGPPGTPGDPGTPGTSCTVVDNGDGTKTITCDDGTVVVTDGTDGTDGGSCTIVDNGDGTKTITCDDGTTVTVTDGDDGDDGDDGEPGGNVLITERHGEDYLQTIGPFDTGGKFFATIQITSATADAAGEVAVSFTVADPAGDPVTSVGAISANIAKLVPASLPMGDAYSKWVPYIYRTQTVSGSATGDWPNPDGTTAIQAYRENTGTLDNWGDGSYTYTFATDISAVVVDGTPITYDRNLTHRISIMMGGSTGPTGDDVFDFVPDGSGAASTRTIVETVNCKACHGWEFHGHGGDRVSVETCATCHVPGNWDPHGGESLDLKTMVHKIHAGGELATIPGTDGLVWDDPATPADESADNGSYAIWGFGNNKFEWWKVGFPAIIENCTKCHQGSGPEVDNWKNVPSRAACGSCHDDVDYATGAGHLGGPQANDAACSLCHTPTLIPEQHTWLDNDARNIPEFGVNLTVSTPLNGSSFEAGEAPVVTLILSEGGVPIDHTTMVEDATAEGCLESGCPPRDGLFRASSLFVHGPRARRMPVLTSAARSRVVAPAAGPWDLSAAGASLIIKLDQGQNLIGYDSSGGDFLIPGTVTVAVVASAFADPAAATGAEVIAWLNANTAFARRAIAYVDEATGRVAIRSRNLGRVHALQLQASVVATNVFGGDVTVKLPTGSTTSNTLAARTVPANNDPKAVRTTGSVTYTLDPVDDLEPGTYVAFVEIADRGRVDGVNYKTPSVAKVTFQVKTATEELAVAGNCDQCHQGPEGTGFVLDYSRHNKIFDDTAIDQCGNCHDYQPQNATGTAWSGARPIAKRVHAVHYGSSLNYPLTTVDYSNGDPIKGRNWDITFPQDVRNCQTCHPDGQTSGTWATEPARLPCMGCHDSDAAVAHMRIMTWDPTPADAWSGDEEESCKACH